MRKAQLELYFEKPSIMRKYGYESEPARCFFFSSPICQIVINKTSRSKGYDVLVRYLSDTFEIKASLSSLSEAIDVFYEYVKNYTKHITGEL